MMEFPGVDICRELFELSGWHDTYFKYIDKNYPSNHWVVEPPVVYEGIVTIPAYDLGYLLRKLPSLCRVSSDHHAYDPHNNNVVYSAGWQDPHHKKESIPTTADTPEDAAAKLTIQLFKQGILTREDN